MELPAYPDNTLHQMWLAEHELGAPKKPLNADSYYLPVMCLGMAVVSYCYLPFVDVKISALVVLAFGALMGGPLVANWFLYRQARASLATEDHRAVVRICQKAKTLRWLPFANTFYAMLLGPLEVFALTALGNAVEAQQALLQQSSEWSDADRMSQMAEIFLLTGNVVRAEAFYTAAYNAVQSGSASYFAKALACTNMGSLMLVKNDGAAASLKYSKEALSLLGTQTDLRTRTLRFHTLRNAARASIRLNQVDEGERMLEQSKQTSENLTKRAGVFWNNSDGELHLAYAELRTLQNRTQEALLHAQCAVDLYRSKNDPGQSMSVYAHKLLASILCRLDREPESIEILARIEADQQKLIEDNEAKVSMIRARLRLTSV